MRELVVTCDGACRQGIGAYGFVIQEHGTVSALCTGSGGLTEEPMTNQRAELWAAIMALECVRDEYADGAITVVSDSAYLINCFNDHWYRKWFANGWRSSKGKAVENRDLWERLFEIVGFLNTERRTPMLLLHPIRWEHVKGHAGHPANEECDAMASRTIDTILKIRRQQALTRLTQMSQDVPGGYR